MHDLEQLFGFALFERLPRGMQPTELGAEVVAFAQRVMVELQRFGQDLESNAAGGYGQLMIGAIMGAAPDVVARAMADIKQKRPLLAIRLLGERSDEIITLLLERKIDLAVGRRAIRSSITLSILKNSVTKNCIWWRVKPTRWRAPKPELTRARWFSLDPATAHRSFASHHGAKSLARPACARPRILSNAHPSSRHYNSCSRVMPSRYFPSPWFATTYLPDFWRGCR